MRPPQPPRRSPLPLFLCCLLLVGAGTAACDGGAPAADQGPPDSGPRDTAPEDREGPAGDRADAAQDPGLDADGAAQGDASDLADGPADGEGPDGADGADGPDGGLDLAAEQARLCTRFAAEECARGITCGDFPQLTSEECLARQLVSCNNSVASAFAAVADGRLLFDPAGVDACTTRLNGCAAFRTAGEACRGIFTGTRALEEICTSPTGSAAGDCAAGFCQTRGAGLCARCTAFPADDTTCGRSASGVPACGPDSDCLSDVCRARGTVGQTCGFPVRFCQAGLICTGSPDTTCQDLERPGPDQACLAGGLCATGLTCSAGLCKTVPLASGAACQENFVCAEGERCLEPPGGGDRTCRAPSGVGIACSTSAQCEPTTFCSPTASFVCTLVPRPARGDDCDNMECPFFGNCCPEGLICRTDTSVCNDPTVRNEGQACNEPDVVCAEPGSCSGDGTCRGYRAVGVGCGAPEDCQSSLVCDASNLCAVRPPDQCQ